MPPPSRHRLRRLLLRGHLWVLAVCMPMLVRLFSLSTLVRLLTPPRFLCPYSGIDADAIAAIVARRLANPRLMRGRPCLRQGLLLLHFLCLAGLPARFHVAVYPPSTDPAKLHGHCWVSLDGRDLMSGPGGPAAEMARCEPGEETGGRLTVFPK